MAFFFFFLIAYSMFSHFCHLTKNVGCFIMSNPKGLHYTNNIQTHYLDWCSSFVDNAQAKFHVSAGKRSADFHCCPPPRDCLLKSKDSFSNRIATACCTSMLFDAEFALHCRSAVSLSLDACPVSHHTARQCVTSASPIQTDLFPNIVKCSSGLHR